MGIQAQGRFVMLDGKLVLTSRLKRRRVPLRTASELPPTPGTRPAHTQDRMEPLIMPFTDLFLIATACLSREVYPHGLSAANTDFHLRCRNVRCERKTHLPAFACTQMKPLEAAKAPYRCVFSRAPATYSWTTSSPSAPTCS